MSRLNFMIFRTRC